MTKPVDERIRDISEAVYKMRLGPDDTRRMLEKDNDGGKMLRGRAKSYDALTHCYLKQITPDDLVRFNEKGPLSD